MPVIALDDVWKFFGNFPALRQIRLNLEPGWCCALLGPDGARESALLRPRLRNEFIRCAVGGLAEARRSFARRGYAGAPVLARHAAAPRFGPHLSAFSKSPVSG